MTKMNDEIEILLDLYGNLLVTTMDSKWGNFLFYMHLAKLPLKCSPSTKRRGNVINWGLMKVPRARTHIAAQYIFGWRIGEALVSFVCGGIVVRL